MKRLNLKKKLIWSLEYVGADDIYILIYIYLCFCCCFKMKYGQSNIMFYYLLINPFSNCAGLKLYCFKSYSPFETHFILYLTQYLVILFLNLFLFRLITDSVMVRCETRLHCRDRRSEMTRLAWRPLGDREKDWK